MHLGMSGWFTVDGPAGLGVGPRGFTKHDHVIFEMSNGRIVIFNDPRRFGFMKVLGAADLAADATLSTLGPEPLGRAFTARVLATALAGRRTAVKVALLDQRNVAGLGNIYACEALHVARLSPKRHAATLVTKAGGPRPEIVALADAIRRVLHDAVANRHRAAGDDRFRVYGHEGERCPRRACPGLIRRIVQAGRSTFFCPICQR
jgi:formamidopyrimidine-DNA glycosylase